MKWIGIVLLGLTLIAVFVIFIGSRLPRAHSASRQARFDVPPERVWSAITDVEKFPTWRSGVKRVTVLPDRAGRKTWVEETTAGRITLTVDKADPPRVLVLRIADPDLPFGGSWTYEVGTATPGSTLTITENGEIYNPLFRFMARFVFGYEKTMADYLSALDKYLAAGQKV